MSHRLLKKPVPGLPAILLEPPNRGLYPLAYLLGVFFILFSGAARNIFLANRFLQIG